MIDFLENKLRVLSLLLISIEIHSANDTLVKIANSQNRIMSISYTYSKLNDSYIISQKRGCVLEFTYEHFLKKSFGKINQSIGITTGYKNVVATFPQMIYLLSEGLNELNLKISYLNCQHSVYYFKTMKTYNRFLLHMSNKIGFSCLINSQNKISYGDSVLSNRKTNIRKISDLNSTFNYQFCFEGGYLVSSKNFNTIGLCLGFKTLTLNKIERRLTLHYPLALPYLKIFSLF